jgi:cytochrome c oxidase cbb3-type subunit III
MRRILILISLALLISSCEREERRFKVDIPSSDKEPVRQSELQPGLKTVNAPAHSGYDENSYAISEGQRLFGWFNCTGCHANGGGGMGPALMDDAWIYGNRPENIFETIMQGRPNGMPSFRGRINQDQAWQIVAYVRAMSGLVPRDVPNSRPDHMKASPNQILMDSTTPVNSYIPKSSETQIK